MLRLQITSFALVRKNDREKESEHKTQNTLTVSQMPRSVSIDSENVFLQKKLRKKTVQSL